MYYRNDNFGCGLIGTILIIAILVSILFSPLTWIIVGCIALYVIIKRALVRNNSGDSYYDSDRSESDYGAYTGGNADPYSYRDSQIAEVTPFTEDEFNTNATDVDVEVSDY